MDGLLPILAAFGGVIALWLGVLTGYFVSERGNRASALTALKEGRAEAKVEAETLAKLHNEAAQQHRLLADKVTAHEFVLNKSR